MVILFDSCVCVLCTVRLAGGRSYNQGRVEVYYNGEWGTVCNNGWDSTDATVVCRQLGLGASGGTLSLRYYKIESGSGLIFLSNVMCSISDHTLASCSHLGVGITYGCDHDDDAGVICYGMCEVLLLCLMHVVYYHACYFLCTLKF